MAAVHAGEDGALAAVGGRPGRPRQGAPGPRGEPERAQLDRRRGRRVEEHLAGVFAQREEVGPVDQAAGHAREELGRGGDRAGRGAPEHVLLERIRDPGLQREQDELRAGDRLPG